MYIHTYVGDALFHALATQKHYYVCTLINVCRHSSCIYHVYLVEYPMHFQQLCTLEQLQCPHLTIIIIHSNLQISQYSNHLAHAEKTKCMINNYILFSYQMLDKYINAIMQTNVNLLNIMYIQLAKKIDYLSKICICIYVLLGCYVCSQLYTYIYDHIHS